MSFFKNPDNGFIQVDGFIVPQQLHSPINKISTDNVSKSNIEKELKKVIMFNLAFWYKQAFSFLSARSLVSLMLCVAEYAVRWL